jgi:hypothetical protein
MARDVTAFLHENKDWHDSWADEIHAIIYDYDLLIKSNKSKAQQQMALATHQSEDEDNSMGPESEDEPDPGIEGEFNRDHCDGDGEDQELYDTPQDGVRAVSQTQFCGSSQPPSPSLAEHSLRRARTITPPESPSAKEPPRPTKCTKLNTITNTFRRSSRLRKQ